MQVKETELQLQQAAIDADRERVNRAREEVARMAAERNKQLDIRGKVSRKPQVLHPLQGNVSCMFEVLPSRRTGCL